MPSDSEREAFEAFILKRWGDSEETRRMLADFHSGYYGSGPMQLAWAAWITRGASSSLTSQTGQDASPLDALVVSIEWAHACKGFGGKLLHVPLGEQCDRCGESAEDDPDGVTTPDGGQDGS